MADEFQDYPKGQISMQGGDLQDAFDINISLDGSETDVHTFAGKGEPSGSTGGKHKNSVTFKSAISKLGFERDYIGSKKNRKVVNCRVKVPGKTLSFTGRIGKLDITSNLDNFIEFTVTIGGKVDFS
jgi:hypothetical protein